MTVLRLICDVSRSSKEQLRRLATGEAVLLYVPDRTFELGYSDDNNPLVTATLNMDGLFVTDEAGLPFLADLVTNLEAVNLLSWDSELGGFAPDDRIATQWFALQAWIKARPNSWFYMGNW